MVIYLYVKQHSITGLKYFGKTKKSDPFRYNGSGKHWVKHISKHGKNYIKTSEIWGFDNQELCTEFALKFSEENNIVESREWANLKLENGLDGNPIGFNHSSKTKQKLSTISKNQKRLPFTDKTKMKMSAAAKKRVYSEEVRQKMSKLRKGKKKAPRSESHKLNISLWQKNKERVICPHCEKVGGVNVMHRWHFDNCKYKN